MLESGAIAEKQLDDLKNKDAVLAKQIDQVKTNFTGIEAEASAIEAAIKQVDELLTRAKVKIPRNGVVVETYAEGGEVVAQGKPLFKMADLGQMKLKAYFSGNQLAQIKIGDQVAVLTDDGKGGLRKYPGVVSWISSEAEFTPKIIQTREERVSLVYAVKIDVANDGFIRINMPGEVKLEPSRDE